MVDICRRVDVDTLISVQPWSYDEFHTALLKHTDQVTSMNQMMLTERIGFFMVEVKSFCDSCVPYPTQVLQRIHHHLPIIAAKANNLLLIVIKVIGSIIILTM